MNIENAPVVKQYAAPTLVVHGKVAELTAGGATGLAENAGNMSASRRA